MVRGNGRQFPIGKNAGDLATKTVVEFRPAAVAVDDPGPSVQKILAEPGDGDIIKRRDLLPAREINDRQIRGIVAEFGEIGPDISVPLAKLAVGEIDPAFDVDDCRLPVDAGFFDRR
jgi:hypothetical protein